MSVSQGHALTEVALCTVWPLSLAVLHQAALTTADPSRRHDSPLLFQTLILTPSHISFGLSDADTHTSLFSRKLFLICWWWLNSGLQQLWNHLPSLFLVCTNYVLQKYLHVIFHCFIAMKRMYLLTFFSHLGFVVWVFLRSNQVRGKTPVEGAPELLNLASWNCAQSRVRSQVGSSLSIKQPRRLRE